MKTLLFIAILLFATCAYGADSRPTSAWVNGSVEVSEGSIKVVDPTTGGSAELDDSTNSIQTIEYEHHEIHSGSSFFVNGYQDLSINNVLDFTFVTPDTTKQIHLTWNIDTESETLWYIYEDAIATNALAGAVVPLNNNRNSLTASVAVLKYEVQTNLTAANSDTNVSAATTLESGISGTGKNSGDDKRSNELILKRNTIYCLRAVATAAGFIDFKMHWYEHTPKN